MRYFSASFHVKCLQQSEWSFKAHGAWITQIKLLSTLSFKMRCMQFVVTAVKREPEVWTGIIPACCSFLSGLTCQDNFAVGYHCVSSAGFSVRTLVETTVKKQGKKCWNVSSQDIILLFGFLFLREKGKEKTWITLGFLQGRRRDYRKKCLKSKSVALKYAAALKCVPEYFKATSNIFINKFVIGLWIGNILCTNKKELFWTHSVFSLVFMDYSVPWL